MQLLNTLYVTRPESYLRLDNDTLRVPLHHLHAVRGGSKRNRAAMNNRLKTGAVQPPRHLSTLLRSTIL